MTNKKRKIIIIEDEQLLRHSFVSIINQSSNYEIVGEYEDVKSSIGRINQYQSLTILLDVHLQGGKTIDTINRLKSINPYNKIIMLSSDSSYQTIVECLRNGADGYLVKEDAVLNLGSYLNLHKDYILSPSAADSICNFIQTASFGRVLNSDWLENSEKQLTQAQKLVYRELLKGKSYHAIAESLGISKNTVAQHVQRIYKARGVNSRAELMVGSYQA